MHELTAEIAEAHYGVARESYAEQTHSIGIQIHTNMAFGLMCGHLCRLGFQFSPFTSELKMEHVVVDRKMRCFKYEEEWRHGLYKVRRYHCSKLKVDDGLDLDWGSVGVYRVHSVSKIVQYIEAKDVRGKGIITKDQILFVWTEDLHNL